MPAVTFASALLLLAGGAPHRAHALGPPYMCPNPLVIGEVSYRRTDCVKDRLVSGKYVFQCTYIDPSSGFELRIGDACW